MTSHHYVSIGLGMQQAVNFRCHVTRPQASIPHLFRFIHLFFNVRSEYQPVLAGEFRFSSVHSWFYSPFLLARAHTDPQPLSQRLRSSAHFVLRLGSTPSAFTKAVTDQSAFQCVLYSCSVCLFTAVGCIAVSFFRTCRLKLLPMNLAGQSSSCVIHATW